MAVETYDCIVIGGGAIGLAVAYELSKRAASVAVIDASLAEHQASWAAAGIVPPADREQAHDAWQRLVARGHELHPVWANELQEATGINVEYTRCGAVHFARTPGEAAALRASCRQWSEDGVAVESLEPASLFERVPPFSRSFLDADAWCAFWVASESRLRPPRFLQALKEACRTNGVTFVDSSVTDWTITNSRATAVTTARGSWAADRFCLTTGAWTGLSLERLGVRIEMKPWRGQMALLRAANGGQLGPVLNEGPNYIVPRSDGRAVVGSTVEDVGFETGTTTEAIESLVEFARATLPGMRFEVESTWSGLRPGTGDGFPYLGFVPGIENLFVAAGHFRSGISQSPATAELVAAHLFAEGKEAGVRMALPEVDLHAFRLERESN
jgi:glycine oxidase